MKALIGVVALVILLVVGLLVMSATPTVAVLPVVKTVGLATPVSASVTGAHGLRRVSAYLEQNSQRYPLFEKAEPSRRLLPQRNQPPQTITFEAGKNKAPELKEGKARLVVEAVSNDLRASSTSVAYDVDVVLAPPRVSADGLQHYVNQGGMELVTFTISGSWSEAGVRAGKYTFRSFPLPGKGPGERFAMFAFPWDLPEDTVPEVYAKNQAGVEATSRFYIKLFPKKFRTRDFPVSDELLKKLVESVDPTGQQAPGPDILSRFLKINGELRRKNNEQMAQLRFKTEDKVMWDGPFIHYGKEEANFADVRNYVYHDKRVDQQVHLGYDLSDVQNAPVNAANDGRVVWAGDLGIYGNCIVLDHGYSLQSIYGHMRQIDVKVGDLIKKHQQMGIAGQTGLAGGVHVHFSMQIDGVQTNPREWWDEHWIHDRILSKLEAGSVTLASPPGQTPGPHKAHKAAKKHPAAR